MATPIRQLVVYDHPKDHPNHYVARWWNVYPGRIEPEQQAFLFKSLDNLRGWILQEWPGLYCLPALAGDEPQILEVWM